MKEKKENKYVYQFVNGDKVVVNLNIHVDADFDWSQLLKEFDRLEYNNNQTESRRHCLPPHRGRCGGNRRGYRGGV